MDEKSRIISFASTHKRILIYGAGTYGKRYYEFLKDNGIDIYGFIVTHKDNDNYCGKKVFEKAEIKNELEINDGIIPAFENVNVNEMRKSFHDSVDIFEVNHIMFLKLITERRIGPILDNLTEKYGIAYPLERQSDIKSILIVRTDAIGDLICTIPFIRELKKNNPDSKITVVIRESNQLILQNCPYIDELLFYKSELISGEIYEQCEKYEVVRDHVKKFANDNFAEKKFDAVYLPRELMAGRNIMDELLIALESGARYRYAHIINTDAMKPYIATLFSSLFTHIAITEKAMHEVMYQLNLLKEIGCEVKDDSMELWSSDNAIEKADKLLKFKGKQADDYLIAIGFVASVPTRTWQSENYAELFEKSLAQYGMQVKFIILGGTDAADEFKRSKIDGKNIINLTGQTTLEETAAVVNLCDLYIGSNTGLLHFASAFGKPSITIYAELEDGLDTDGDSPVKMGAWKTNSISLVPPAGLDGCHRVCRMGFSHCINQITPHMVMEKMKGFIEK